MLVAQDSGTLVVLRRLPSTNHTALQWPHLGIVKISVAHTAKNHQVGFRVVCWILVLVVNNKIGCRSALLAFRSGNNPPRQTPSRRGHYHTLWAFPPSMCRACHAAISCLCVLLTEHLSTMTASNNQQSPLSSPHASLVAVMTTIVVPR